MKDGSAGKRSAKRTVLTIVCVILAIILTVMLAGTIYVTRLMNRMNRVDGSEETLSQDELNEYIQQEETEAAPRDPATPTVNAEDIEWQEPAETETLIGESDNIVNILLIGQDRREGEGRSRSDSMVLCTFNKEKKTLTMTSFLRDLYVQIPGYQDTKLNHAYPAGGMSLLNETLKVNFGVHIDGNVEVDFSGFTKIVDLLGGVDIELRADEAAVINRSTDSALQAGMQHLNGDQAMVYSRIRSLDSDADFSRTNRQRKILGAILDKFKHSDLRTILQLMDQVMPMITTNMSNAEIIGYVTDLFPLLAEAEIVSQRVPGDGTYSCPYIRGMSVVLADMEAARKLLRDTIGD